MSSGVRIIIATLLLMCLTLPFKLFLHQPSEKPIQETKAKSLALGKFLRESGLSVAGPLPIKPPIDWPGWRVSAGACHFVVTTEDNLEQESTVLKLFAGSGRSVSYVYRGEISDTPPLNRIGFDKILQRIIYPVHPPLWRRPLAVAVISPVGCREFERWPWGRLWDGFTAPPAEGPWS